MKYIRFIAIFVMCILIMSCIPTTAQDNLISIIDTKYVQEVVTEDTYVVPTEKVSVYGEWNITENLNTTHLNTTYTDIANFDEYGGFDGVYNSSGGGSNANNRGGNGHINIVKSEIDKKYKKLGGANGILGPPVGEEKEFTNGGHFRQFKNGAIYWSLQYGAREVHGAIWRSLIGEETLDVLSPLGEGNVDLILKLGFPITDEITTSDSRGRFNDFEYGSIYSSEKGTYIIEGPIKDEWSRRGKDRSNLGYPVTNAIKFNDYDYYFKGADDAHAEYQNFEHGGIIWYPTDNDINVYGSPFDFRQISGAEYLDFAKEDDADYYETYDGVLLAYHDPGCGFSGNEGDDKFFVSKSLPPDCWLLEYSYKAFFPNNRPGAWGVGLNNAGSYGSRITKKPTANDESLIIHWENSCTGSLENEQTVYAVSFLVFGPIDQLGGVDASTPNAGNIEPFEYLHGTNGDWGGTPW
jgi:hypothetical protein